MECGYNINSGYQGKAIPNTILNSMGYFQYICGGHDCTDPEVLWYTITTLVSLLALLMNIDYIPLASPIISKLFNFGTFYSNYWFILGNTLS